MLQQINKSFFTALAENKMFEKLARKFGFKLGAKRFVAGVTVDTMVEAVKELNAKGLKATIDYLGEFVNSDEETVYMTDQVIESLKAIHEHKLDSHISLKLTSLGLDISKELTINNMSRILDLAVEYDVMVTIDIEDSPRTDITLEVFEALIEKYPNHISTVLQSYLFRTKDDLENMLKYKPFVRYVRGAYKEPKDVAFQDKPTIDKELIDLIVYHLESGAYPAVGSHDPVIFNAILDYCDKNDVPKENLEFQMLYGLKTRDQVKIAQKGYTMRVYVPYGIDWYGYFMRRLAEKPENVWFILKNLFKR